MYEDKKSLVNNNHNDFFLRNGSGCSTSCAEIQVSELILHWNLRRSQLKIFGDWPNFNYHKYNSTLTLTGVSLYCAPSFETFYAISTDIVICFHLLSLQTFSEIHVISKQILLLKKLISIYCRIVH